MRFESGGVGDPIAAELHIASLVRHRRRRRFVPADEVVVVLDDDPTGTQTTSGGLVLLEWTRASVAAAIEAGERLIFLETNSRALLPGPATRLARTTGRLLRDVSMATGIGLSIVSRSDSTLRGHFPAEVDALADGLGWNDTRILLAPFLGDSGRVTLDGVHYLRSNGRAVPVAETEFAADRAFGYRSSDLRAWVAERAGASRSATLVPLHTLREAGPKAVADALAKIEPGGVCIVDAVDEGDIETVADGIHVAESLGISVIARTAASYVRARAGQRHSTTLDARVLRGGRPGLIVIGSHTQTTTRQLERLKSRRPETALVEVEIEPWLNGLAATDVNDDVGDTISTFLAAGTTVALVTPRTYRRSRSATAELLQAQAIAAGVGQLVAGIDHRPAWVIGKGGITSYRVARDGLGAIEARVLGPLLPGVALWITGPTGRWPGIPYLVFPGNLGGDYALAGAVERLESASTG